MFGKSSFRGRTQHMRKEWANPALKPLMWRVTCEGIFPLMSLDAEDSTWSVICVPFSSRWSRMEVRDRTAAAACPQIPVGYLTRFRKELKCQVAYLRAV